MIDLSSDALVDAVLTAWIAEVLGTEFTVGGSRIESAALIV